MNATELFDGLAAIPAGQDAGSTDGVAQSRVVSGVEYARTDAVDERRIRASWRKRQGGGAAPLLLISDDPDEDGRLRVLGPGKDGPVRRIRAEALLELAQATSNLGKLEAIRRLAEELERLDAEGVPGLVVRGLGTEHLYRTRLPAQDRWAELEALTPEVPSTGWREVLEALGYEVTELSRRGYMAKAGGRPVIVIHPRRSAEEFARLDEAGRLPEGALLADCDANGAAYGMLAAGTRMRLLRAVGDEVPRSLTTACPARRGASSSARSGWSRRLRSWASGSAPGT